MFGMLRTMLTCDNIKSSARNTAIPLCAVHARRPQSVTSQVGLSLRPCFLARATHQS